MSSYYCYSTVNLFIYQARESSRVLVRTRLTYSLPSFLPSFTPLREDRLERPSRVPAGFLTAQFLQKLLIYEAFVVMGRKGKV